MPPSPLGFPDPTTMRPSHQVAGPPVSVRRTGGAIVAIGSIQSTVRIARGDRSSLRLAGPKTAANVTESRSGAGVFQGQGRSWLIGASGIAGQSPQVLRRRPHGSILPTGRASRPTEGELTTARVALRRTALWRYKRQELLQSSAVLRVWDHTRGRFRQDRSMFRRCRWRRMRLPQGEGRALRLAPRRPETSCC